MKNFVKTLSFSALVSVGALTASQVFAHGPGALFDRFDANDDGKVTRDEVQTKAREHFARLDGNGDRVVTPEEVRQHVEAKRKRHGSPERWVEAQFRAHDENENGKLERSELRLPDEVFARLDQNGDGVVTKPEALASARKRHERMKQRRDEGPRGRRHGTDQRSHFERIDENGDGKIDQREATAAADRVFSRFDQNSDNVVTRDEVTSKMRHHRSDRRGGGKAKKRK